jgi:hypothetical protein
MTIAAAAMTTATAITTTDKNQKKAYRGVYFKFVSTLGRNFAL